MSRDVQWLDKFQNGHSKFHSREEDTGATSPIGNGEDDEDDNKDCSKSIPKAETTDDETPDDGNIDDETNPSEGWHTVKAGRETIVYEATPTAQTRSGANYKSDIAVLANTYSVL
jgi:hypothetical protein